MKTVAKRMVQGAIISIGAPIGWLCIQWVVGVTPAESIYNNLLLYNYLLFGTCFVFVAYGYFIGRQEAYIETLALNDHLTGIYNLRYYQARLQEEVIKSNREKQALSIISFDLDHFKQVNDSHGHAIGDKVLTHVVDTVRSQLRKHDVFARVGGEEFSILIPGCELAEAREKAEQLRITITKAGIPITDRLSLVITASFGVTQYQLGEPVERFLRRADAAMYAAKEGGRNNTTVLKSEDFIDRNQNA